MYTLESLIYKLFFKIFYEKNDKTINFINNFL